MDFDSGKKNSELAAIAMRKTALFGVSVSFFAAITAIVFVPMLYNYVYYIQSSLDSEVDFCHLRTDELIEQFHQVEAIARSKGRLRRNAETNYYNRDPSHGTTRTRKIKRQYGDQDHGDNSDGNFQNNAGSSYGNSGDASNKQYITKGAVGGDAGYEAGSGGTGYGDGGGSAGYEARVSNAGGGSTGYGVSSSGNYRSEGYTGGQAVLGPDAGGSGRCGCSTGPPGPPGPPGRDGTAGMDGRRGLDGARGKDDEISPEDQVCFTCPRGAPGVPGGQGRKGTPGRPGRIGNAGSRGTSGQPGSIGSQGQNGNPGQPGRIGTHGLRGTVERSVKTDLRGPPGPTGRDGPPGNNGLPGPYGSPGSSGPPGPLGRPGKAGSRGNDGFPGIDGNEGQNGEQGACDHCPVPRTAPGY